MMADLVGNLVVNLLAEEDDALALWCERISIYWPIDAIQTMRRDLGII